MTRQGPALLVSLLLVLGARPATALKNCPDVDSADGDYKVALDDFAYGSTQAQGNSDLAGLRARVEFGFEGEFANLKKRAKALERALNVTLRIANCSGRTPSLSGSEFDEAAAETLSDKSVVVEMWGQLDLEGAPPVPTARINYLMPPVRHYAPNADTPSLVRIEYPKDRAAPVGEQIDNLKELTAFALVGVATKAAQAEKYDLAISAYREAHQVIQDVRVGATNDSVARLRKYVDHEACQTRLRAIAAHYPGALVLTETLTCPTEVP
jgi:hypothetical protein